MGFKKIDYNGLNQDELKGIVISDESVTPTCWQYDALYEALNVLTANAAIS